MELKFVDIEKPEEMNFILGQSHFIKTIEDLYEAVVQTVPGMKFGIAFCESSGPALVRWAGNSPELIELAQKTRWPSLRATRSLFSWMAAFPSTFSTPSKAFRKSAGFSAPRPIECRSSWRKTSKAAVSSA
jgi:adenosine/AMP kinase